jgi:RimJ/RimL family protein N-acetyltransferase
LRHTYTSEDDGKIVAGLAAEHGFAELARDDFNGRRSRSQLRHRWRDHLKPSLLKKDAETISAAEVRALAFAETLEGGGGHDFTSEEDGKIVDGLAAEHGFAEVARDDFNGRLSESQVGHRWRRHLKPSLLKKKMAETISAAEVRALAFAETLKSRGTRHDFTPGEDGKIVDGLAAEHGFAELARDDFNGRRSRSQLRHRWRRHLKPSLLKKDAETISAEEARALAFAKMLKRGRPGHAFTSEEDGKIVDGLAAEHGFAEVARDDFNGRLSSSQVRSRWRRHLKPSLLEKDAETISAEEARALAYAKTLKSRGYDFTSEEDGKIVDGLAEGRGFAKVARNDFNGRLSTSQVRRRWRDHLKPSLLEKDTETISAAEVRALAFVEKRGSRGYDFTSEEDGKIVAGLAAGRNWSKLAADDFKSEVTWSQVKHRWRNHLEPSLLKKDAEPISEEGARALAFAEKLGSRGGGTSLERTLAHLARLPVRPPPPGDDVASDDESAHPHLDRQLKARLHQLDADLEQAPKRAWVATGPTYGTIKLRI